MSRFDTPLNPGPPDSDDGNIDITKRYDIYCVEMGQRVVVYRSARLKYTAQLFRTGKFDSGAQFIALEQSNGQTVYIQRHTLIKLCEPGVEMTAEVIALRPA